MVASRNILMVAAARAGDLSDTVERHAKNNQFQLQSKAMEPVAVCEPFMRFGGYESTKST